MPGHKELLQEFEALAASSAKVEALMQKITDRLHEEISRYNWVGFYLIDPADARYLICGPYTGSFTPNVRFLVDRGLCGAAVTSRKTVIVNDVTKDPRYLQGTDMVKSEMVVPIQVRQKVVAELDVESYFLNTFNNPRECEFVESCAALVGRWMEQHKS
jgi:L-methionine (R)-S-oxide reductase